MSNSNHQKQVIVLFADIQGYTAMMENNEVQTATFLHRFHSQIEEKVKHNQGQIIQFYGDGVLCVFEQGLLAVQCAMQLQTQFNQSPKIPVRIGLHKGKVTFEKDNIYGHTVNLTSRIESIGVPNSILFSQPVKDEIAEVFDIKFKSLGRFEFKNVKHPVEIFAIANKGFIVPKRSALKGKLKPKSQPVWLLPALIATVFLLLGVWFADNRTIAKATVAEKSIAVLPFENLNQDSTKDYFSDGIAQDILSNLSGIKDLTVISFNSSKQFRTREESTKAIGEALGVHHLLTGSVQHYNNRIIIRATLENTATNEQLWANRYDLEMKDIFAVQSDVSNEIAELLKAEILPLETKRIYEKPTENLAAWQEYAQGRYQWELRTKESLKKAEKHFLKAIELDSTFAQAYTGLAQTYTLQGTDFFYDRDLLFQKSKELSEKAITLNPRIADAYAAIGYYYFSYEIDINKSIEYYQKATEFGPGEATTHQWYAEALISKGDIETARKEIDIALRLDPRSRIIKVVDALTSMCEDEYERAIVQLEVLTAQYPDLWIAPWFLMKTYVMTGQFDKALRWWEKVGRGEALPILYHLETGQVDKIKERLAQPNLPDGLKYLMENDLILLTENLDLYLSRVDSSIFYYRYNTTDMLQYFPPPDSVRQHPKFQALMEKGDFYVRHRSSQLN